jgi:hypothetical protein
MFAKLTQFSKDSKSSAPAETFGEAGLLTSASPLGYGGNDPNAPLSPYPITFAAYAPPGDGDAERSASLGEAQDAGVEVLSHKIRADGKIKDLDADVVGTPYKDVFQFWDSNLVQPKYKPHLVLTGTTFPTEFPGLGPNEAYNESNPKLRIRRAYAIPYMPFAVDINVKTERLADIQIEIFETGKIEHYDENTGTWNDVTKKDQKQRRSMTGLVTPPEYKPGEQETTSVVAKLRKTDGRANYRIICADVPNLENFLVPNRLLGDSSVDRLSITQEIVVHDKSGKHKDVTIRLAFMIGDDEHGKLAYTVPKEIP